jgi:integrase
MGKFFNKKIQIPTFNEYFKKSMTIHEHRRKTTTQQSYERIYELHIQPYFGEKKLDSVNVSDIGIWNNMLLKKVSPKTMKPIRTILNTIFTDAINDELIQKNPVAFVQSPISYDTRLKKPFTEEEVMSILSSINRKMRCYFAIGFFTGMRTGEIIGLKWDDIDLDNKIIKVRRSIRQGIESLPKTKNSIRDVEIIDFLMPFIKKHRKISSIDSTYVFETKNGKAFTTSDKIAYWYWKPALKKLNLEYRNLYQMRHTFASMMISHGEDILWVSNMLGHKDSSTTLQVYSRYVRSKDRKRGIFLGQYKS